MSEKKILTLDMGTLRIAMYSICNVIYPFWASQKVQWYGSLNQQRPDRSTKWKWLFQVICLGNKGWTFLKKLWCCVTGGNKVIWWYQLSWKCKLATVISIKLTFRALALRQSESQTDRQAERQTDRQAERQKESGIHWNANTIQVATKNAHITKITYYTKNEMS